jgi:hypothetical protein
VRANVEGECEDGVGCQGKRGGESVGMLEEEVAGDRVGGVGY